MYKMNVPVTLSSHIETALQELVDDNRVPENYGGCVDTQLQEICHTSYDGFIPFTNGGFDLTLPTDLHYVYGSGNGPANKKVSDEIDKVIEQSLQDALEAFCEKNSEKLGFYFLIDQIKNPNADVINYHSLYDMEQGKLAEELSEYETEYMSEGSTFFYQFRVMYFAADNARNESGDDEILFLAGTNLDFEYGRDSGLEVTYENCVPVELLTTEQIDTIINEMVDSI
jgi:hypothetical protein